MSNKIFGNKSSQHVEIDIFNGENHGRYTLASNFPLNGLNTLGGCVADDAGLFGGSAL